jgi:hypothetical protein
MGLFCDCGDYDGDGPFWYETPDYTTMAQLGRRKRCCSCKSLIDHGATAVEFKRFRTPNYDSIEERIYGEGAEIHMASWWIASPAATSTTTLLRWAFASPCHPTCTTCSKSTSSCT